MNMYLFVLVEFTTEKSFDFPKQRYFFFLFFNKVMATSVVSYALFSPKNNLQANKQKTPSGKHTPYILPELFINVSLLYLENHKNQ